jgi:TupA-like ATPgrasp
MQLINRISNRLFKILYWPICRAYVRHIVGDRPADAILRWLCSPQFWRVHRFWPDFVHPRRFTEKLWSRMLHDRDPQLTLVNDKLRVRDYTAAKVGSKYLIPLLWHGNNPEEIPFDELPLKFVIKTNHGCGYIIIVKDKTQLDQNKARQQLKKWLGENHCQDIYLGTEWGYKNIKPCIIIETFIEENGKAPVDYKFYCFSGRIEFLTLHFDRFEEHKTRSFDRNFEPNEFRYDFEQWGGECQRPPNFETMVQLVESLAEGFDFMRVDLYSIENMVYFSELTPYPGGVSTKFLPASYDYVLGKKWLPT